MGMGEPTSALVSLDASPSTKYVVYVLADAGPLSREELCQRTGLPESTVGEALRRLEEAGILDKRAAPEDLRRRVYDIHPPSDISVHTDGESDVQLDTESGIPLLWKR